MAYKYKRELIIEEWMTLKEFVKKNYVDTEHLYIIASKIKKEGWFFPEVVRELDEKPYGLEEWEEYYREHCATDDEYDRRISEWLYKYYQSWYIENASISEGNYNDEDDTIFVDVIDDYELYEENKDDIKLKL